MTNDDMNRNYSLSCPSVIKVNVDCIKGKKEDCQTVVLYYALQVLSYLCANNLNHQHGFLSRHSTVSNLLESVNDRTLALNNSKGIAVAYVDYAKAFDVVITVNYL